MPNKRKSSTRNEGKAPFQESSAGSTGIYRQVTVRLLQLGRKGQTRREASLAWREFRQYMDLAFPGILKELDRLEKAARAIIKSEGGTPGLWKEKLSDGRIRYERIHLPEGARPVASRARELIFAIWSARHYLREGNIEAATWATYTVGRIAEMVRVSPFEPVVIRGAKVRAGQLEGRRKRAENYERNYARFQDEVDWLASAKPHLSYTEISRRVGSKAQFPVTGRTVRKHTKNPRKK